MYAAISKPNKPVQDTHWDGSQWDNGTPTTYKDAYIDGNYTTLTGSFTCRNLFITGTSELTIIADTHVKVLSNLEQEATSQIIVKHKGNLMLLNKSDTVPTARIRIERVIENMQRLDYSHITSPVSGILLKSISPGTLDNRFYSYDEGTNIYFSINPNTEITSAGKGYLIRTPNNFPSIPTDWNINIDNFSSGILNSGVISVPVVYSRFGFILIGNPYPTTLSLRKFYEVNKKVINPIFYVWGNRTNGSQGLPLKNYNLITNNYSDDNLIIYPFQAFFIQKLNSSLNEVIFTPEMIIPHTDYSIPDRFHINLFQQNINFPIGAFCYDSKQYNNNFINQISFEGDDNSISIIKNDDSWLVYQEDSYSDNSFFDLKLFLTVADTYTLTLKDVSGLFGDLPSIFVVDNLENVTHNLKSSHYTFFSEAGTFTDRFTIQFE